MHAFDNDFFEEYKRLDKLCADMFSCQNGVSEYIAQMEERSAQGRQLVSGWDTDYKMLKHVRWVRNQIAHNIGSDQVSDPADLIFVKQFIKRLYSGQGPLTLLSKSNKNAAGYQEKSIHSYNAPQTERPNHHKRNWTVFVVVIIIGVLLWWLLYLSKA